MEKIQTKSEIEDQIEIIDDLKEAIRLYNKLSGVINKLTRRGKFCHVMAWETSRKTSDPETRIIRLGGPEINEALDVYVEVPSKYVIQKPDENVYK